MAATIIPFPSNQLKSQPQSLTAENPWENFAGQGSLQSLQDAVAEHWTAGQTLPTLYNEHRTSITHSYQEGIYWVAEAAGGNEGFTLYARIKRREKKGLRRVSYLLYSYKINEDLSTHFESLRVIDRNMNVIA